MIWEKLTVVNFKQLCGR